MLNKIVLWLKANKGEIARLAILGLTMINQFLAMRGKSPLPISNDDLNYWTSTGITTVVSVYTFFKQNKFNVPAKKEDTK